MPSDLPRESTDLGTPLPRPPWTALPDDPDPNDDWPKSSGYPTEGDGKSDAEDTISEPPTEQ